MTSVVFRHSTHRAVRNFVTIPSFPARQWARCFCLAGWAGISPEEVVGWIIQQLVGKTILLGSTIDLTLKQYQHYSLDSYDWSYEESFIYELLLLVALLLVQDGWEALICRQGMANYVKLYDLWLTISLWCIEGLIECITFSISQIRQRDNKEKWQDSDKMRDRDEGPVNASWCII